MVDRCLGILLEIKSYPGEFPIFRLIIICSTLFGVVCFAGRDIGSGLSKKLVIVSRSSESGFVFGCELNIFERWFSKIFALSLSDKASTSFRSFKEGVCSLVLRIFFIAIFHSKQSFKLIG